MNDTTKGHLLERLNSIKANLGTLAYRRRDLEIQIEGIDKDVAQMEAQGVVIEATLNDLNADEQATKAAAEKEANELKEARSERAKAAAAKRKREKAEEASRKGKATSKT